MSRQAAPMSCHVRLHRSPAFGVHSIAVVGFVEVVGVPVQPAAARSLQHPGLQHCRIIPDHFHFGITSMKQALSLPGSAWPLALDAQTHRYHVNHADALQYRSRLESRLVQVTLPENLLSVLSFVAPSSQHIYQIPTFAPIHR